MSTVLERARSIAVALEQENARLRELAAILADRWTEIADGMQVLGRAAALDDPMGRIRLERALVLKSSARDLRWVLDNGTLPHDLMTSAELGEEGTS